jgi:hypothetical protein
VGDRFFQDLKQAPASPKITWKRVSSEKYEVQVRGSQGGFVLGFGEAYDPLWTARIEGEGAQDPLRLYSTMNGFQIFKSGDFKITLEYQPQRWFSQAIVISLTVLALCFLYFIVALFNKRKRSTR